MHPQNELRQMADVILLRTNLSRGEEFAQGLVRQPGDEMHGRSCHLGVPDGVVLKIRSPRSGGRVPVQKTRKGYVQNNSNEEGR